MNEVGIEGSGSGSGAGLSHGKAPAVWLRMKDMFVCRKVCLKLQKKHMFGSREALSDVTSNLSFAFARSQLTRHERFLTGCHSALLGCSHKRAP